MTGGGGVLRIGSFGAMVGAAVSVAVGVGSVGAGSAATVRLLEVVVVTVDAFLEDTGVALLTRAGAAVAVAFRATVVATGFGAAAFTVGTLVAVTVGVPVAATG